MSGFPSFSEGASLAIHTVALLAASPDRRLQTKEIAGVLDASEAHLAKVLQRLVKTGLVRSVRGPQGGFLLTPDAAETTLLEVYEAVDGPLTKHACLLGDPVCRGENCVLGELLNTVTDAVRRYLTETRVSQLAQIRWKTKSHGNRNRSTNHQD